MITLPDSDSYVDSCTKKVTMDINGMAPRAMLKGCSPGLSLGLSLGPVKTLPNITIFNPIHSVSVQASV